MYQKNKRRERREIDKRDPEIDGKIEIEFYERGIHVHKTNEGYSVEIAPVTRIKEIQKNNTTRFTRYVIYNNLLILAFRLNVNCVNIYFVSYYNIF